jgi:hypothetical protein
MQASHYTLPSGTRCELSTPKLPFVRHYYILHFAGASCNPGDIAQMWEMAYWIAQDLGQRHFGDPGCFSVLINGGRTRRRPWPHLHILAAKSPAAKRWGLFCMSIKRILRWRRWWILRPFVGSVGR